MRAKLKVGHIDRTCLIASTCALTGSMSVRMHAVAKNGTYPADGSDEDNSFARWSPSADLNITIANPALFDKITEGDTFYVDFTKVAPAPAVASNETDEGVIADKTLRVLIDSGLQKLKALPPSRERSLSITKLQEAIMWLGMDLKRLNDTRPYPSSYDPSTAKVEPTADGLKL